MKTRPLCFACLFFLLFQVILLIVTSGDSIGEIPASSIYYDEKEKSVLIDGQVYKKTNTSKIQILYLKNNSTNDSNIMVYDDNFIDVSIGEKITLQGTTQCFDVARNPGNFDQRLFYAKQNIYGAIWCEEVLEIAGERNWLMENLHQLKEKWKKQIYGAIGEENGTILTAMLLGEKDDMDPEMKEFYQKNGIGHVLAISGLHISFIGLGIYRLIKRTGIGYILSGLLAVVCLSLYVLMIGFSVSVLRAFIMLLFRVGADMSGRVYDMITALMVAAAITVYIQPLYLVDAGFLMSYGAILGIIFMVPTLQRMLKTRRKLFAGFYASLAIHIMLFPIMLFFYYEFSTYSMFLNLLVIPLMSVVMGFGMVGVLASTFICPLAQVFFGVCNLVLEFFEWLSRIGSKLPIARIVIGQPDLWKIMVYYIVLIIFLLVFMHDRMVKSIKKMRKVFIGIFILMLIMFTYRSKGSLTITMLDVGQGDGILLRGPKGDTYFIDGGSSDVSQLTKYRIEPFLKSQGVGELDYVFITHGDKDHYSGIEEMLIRQDIGVKVKHLVFPSNWKQDEELQQLGNLARKQGVSLLVMEAGQSIVEGDMQLVCVQPTMSDTKSSGNAGSLVLALYYYDFSMLCTGDVEDDGEATLTKRVRGQTFDVLKVAHHGSKHSSSMPFLQTICPKVALISAGEANSYGHPHKETLERLQSMKCKVLTTIKNGAITLQTDGNSLTFQCFIY